jgi:catechol 2,3-dioxygenase-like lactoylglutathione lyase family enzyme
MAGVVSSTTTRFVRAIFMVRGAEGVSRAVDFYHVGLGLSVLRHTDEWAELSCGGAGQPFTLNLHAVSNEAQLSVGYSPMLSFEVVDMDSTIAKCVQMGAHLDGPIQYPAHGKVAAMRAPDGHMIGLYQPNM